MRTSPESGLADVFDRTEPLSTRPTYLDQPIRPGINPVAYYGLPYEFIEQVREHTEADPAALLVQYLAAFGSVVGRGPHCDISDDRHGTALYVTLVGPTGEGRKGTSWSPVRKRFKHCFPDWAEQVVSGGLSSGEGLIQALRDGQDLPDDEQPTEEQDKRLLVVESELAGPLNRIRRDGNTLSATLRSFWDSGDASVLTRADPLRCTDAHLTIVGHITEHELKTKLAEGEVRNGFANRFLWFLVKRSRSLPFGGNMKSIDWTEHDGKLRRVVDLAKARHVVDMNAAARELWETRYDELTSAIDSMVGPLVERRAPQARRLALIYALLDGADIVDENHLAAALAVVDFARESVEYLFGGKTGDTTTDRILGALIARGTEGMRRSEFDALFNGNLRARQLQACLEEIQQLGLAQSERISNGRGRPSEIWYAVGR